MAPVLLGQAKTDDAWKSLSFLEGSWEAKTKGGSAGADSAGGYSFQFDLKRHVLARYTEASSSCKGPKDFDCQHGDLLYIYQDAPGAPLKAIYFDNEGHVIHYDVAPAEANMAIFLSEPGRPEPWDPLARLPAQGSRDVRPLRDEGAGESTLESLSRMEWSKEIGSGWRLDISTRFCHNRG